MQDASPDFVIEVLLLIIFIVMGLLSGCVVYSPLTFYRIISGEHRGGLAMFLDIFLSLPEKIQPFLIRVGGVFGVIVFTLLSLGMIASLRGEPSEGRADSDPVGAFHEEFSELSTEPMITATEGETETGAATTASDVNGTNVTAGVGSVAAAPVASLPAAELPDSSELLIEKAGEKWNEGDIATAILLAEKARALRLKLYEADHPKVQEVEAMLATARQAQQ